MMKYFTFHCFGRDKWGYAQDDFDNDSDHNERLKFDFRLELLLLLLFEKKINAVLATVWAE